MRHAWFTRIGIVALVGGLCLVGYGLAHAEKPIKDRFKVSHKDPAWVLDRTTGLQWQKATTTESMAWSTASTYCTDLGDGSRMPEVKELISLVDYGQYYPALPADHPFTNVVEVNDHYWSASTFVGDLSRAFTVGFVSGDVENNDKTGGFRVWCVR